MVRKLNEMSDPKISLCMIVKDEEELLPQMLESVKGAWDELIVVDTGSTDGTVELALKAGAKIRVHPWEENFSKHRNQSIDYATGDWILIMDADEVLVDGSVDRIRLGVKEKEHDLLVFGVKSFTDNGAHHSNGGSPRLFRSGLGIHYEGRVHNQLIFEPHPEKMNHCGASILHYGYDLSPEKMKVKREMSLRLLRKSVEEKPEDFSATHHLAVTLLAEKKWKEAGKWARKTFEIIPSLTPNLGWTAFILAYSLLREGEFKECLKVCGKYSEKWPWQVDLWFCGALALAALGEWEACRGYCEEYKRIRKSLLSGELKTYAFHHFETIDKVRQINTIRGRALGALGPERLLDVLCA